MNYNFSTINDKDFEELVRDLLNAKFNLNLQSFKEGKDKGIDLRYSTPNNNNELIVQCKHFVKSKFAQLKQTLKKELLKLNKLNPKPKRYILVTALPLSAYEKDDIKNLLSPFILNSSDVIGQDDLNAYLSDFPDIEKKYFKLWFSSITILESIFNNAVEGRSRYLLESIANKGKLYVATKQVEEADSILMKEKILLITGQPGIGKTTLAEMLLFGKAKMGYKVYQVENISEAEDIISINNEDKQVFYFDDFLGSNYLEITNSHKTETQITRFVERVRNTPCKYLILTTRSIILNHAIERYEKIAHSKLSHEQYELKLEDYNEYEKAKILYNHLYFRDLKKHLRDCIFKDKFYWKIIKHKNYTPRIIDFITDKVYTEGLTEEAYTQFIISNLNNPKEIWHRSFNNQIGYFDKCLLVTLFSFPSNVNEDILSNAFENRLHYEKETHNQIITTDIFHDSIRVLLNGFIIVKTYSDNSSGREYAFINPSLRDFLIEYIVNSPQEMKSLISSIIYTNQLYHFHPDRNLLYLKQELQNIIFKKISGQKLIFSGNNHIYNEISLIYLELLNIFCTEVDIDSYQLNILQTIKVFFNKWNNRAIHRFCVLLPFFQNNSFKYIQENFIFFIENIISKVSNEGIAKSIPDIFTKYNQNYFHYVGFNDEELDYNDDNKLDTIAEIINSVLESKEDELKDEWSDIVFDEDVVHLRVFSVLSSLEFELYESLIPYMQAGNYQRKFSLDRNYWEKCLQDNLEKFENDTENPYNYTIRTEPQEFIIDDLFTQND